MKNKPDIVDTGPVKFASNFFTTSEDKIRKQIQDLVARGNVTSAELYELQCNSYEWEALVPAMTNEAFVERMQHALDNCDISRRPFLTCDEAVKGLFAPELLKRFRVTFLRG